MVERILDEQGLILAILIRGSYQDDGIKFFSPDEFPLQVGYMGRPHGYVIKPHVHNPVERTISYTHEVLFIKRGKVRVDFYNNDKEYLKSEILNQGDVVLLAYGGHGFKVIEEAEIIEVKQGPYCGELDKVRFEPIADEQVKFLK